MLTRLVLSYIAGVATMVVAHSAASGAPEEFGFTLGSLSTLIALALVLVSSRRRAAATARLILRIVGPDVRVMKVRTEATKAIKRSAPESRVSADVFLALRSLECGKETARWAVGQATSRLPHGSFEDVFKMAVQIATTRARSAA